MPLTIYYSDFGLQREKKLNDKINHILNIKLLVLLSTEVLIPISHLMHAETSDIAKFSNNFSEFFRENYIFTQLPTNVNNMNEHFKQYINNDRYKDIRDKLKMNSFLLSNKLLPENRTFKVYSSYEQMKSYHLHIIEFITDDNSLSDKTKKDILNFINSNYDINNPLSKKGFETFANELVKRRRKNAEHIKYISEMCYYISGSETNSAIISSNHYLTQRSLSEINKYANTNYSSSEYYNPKYFYDILKSLNIIENETDITNLTFQEIQYLKKQKEFKQFIELYYELSLACQDLTLLLDKTKFERVKLIKNLAFNFGLTISETVLSTYIFKMDNNPFVAMFILWILNSFLENSSFKPLKTFRYYSVGLLIDKIAFSNDIFLYFCSKLKRSIEKCK